MSIGEIIYGLITLALMVLIIFSPLIRKIIKSIDKSKSDPELPQDNIYESVDSHRVVQRILNENESIEKVEFIQSKPLRPLMKYEHKFSIVNKLDKMPPLKRAIIWKEILSSPVALRDLGRDDYI